MLYQKEIVNRLASGLESIDADAAVVFREQFSAPRRSLRVLTEEITSHYEELASKPSVRAVGIPENAEAIPFWIKDLEEMVLPIIRANKV